MSILDALGPYKLLIEVAIIGSLALGGVVKVHRAIENHDERVRNEVRAEYAQKLAETKDAARQRETELRTQRDDAINKGNEREQTIRSLAASNGAAAVGLRDTVASISNSMSSYSADTLRSLASAYGVVFAECAERRAGLAEEAERLNSEKQTLIEAWPVDPAKK